MNTLSLLSPSLAVHLLLGCWLTGLGGQGEQQVPQLQDGHEGEAQEQAGVPSQLQQFRNCDIVKNLYYVCSTLLEGTKIYEKTNKAMSILKKSDYDNTVQFTVQYSTYTIGRVW
jgi:hypothetical protein